ncbi:MAG: coproporphyrinogen dehydrogenase HemZ [Lachnospiraceae bacterium]|nr:coproporphyrinogen dehydrogenase HemZ [Lachnospiraceae bacterium]
MITVMLDEPSFQYDVHSLIKAFYPQEDITFPATEDQTETSGFLIETGADGGRPENEPCRIVCRYVEDKKTVSERESCLNPSDSDEAAEERLRIKNELKRTLYRLLEEITGRSLPWGTLTGIRPVKIPMKMLQEGHDEREIRTCMQENYFTSDEKIRLATDIAKRERNILQGLHTTDGFSLYIGIPFCPTTCMYCSFTSYPIGKYRELTDAYLAALDAELGLISETFAGKVLDSIYIGGGTPTTLESSQMETLRRMLETYFDLRTVREFTMEAGRPDSITVEKLATMRAIGIDRMSVNPQTMHDETLKVIGRRHSVQQTVEAFHMAREAGFTNINMDIILGLPGEDEAMLQGTLDQIESLSPDALTVHSMAIKRAAAMQDFLKEHKELESKNTPEMMDLCGTYAERMGMHPYYLYRQKNMTGNFENVGYAADGKYGLYNILIMEEVQHIAAAGAGTISKILFQDGRIERCDTIKDVDLYLRSLDSVIEKKRAFFSRLP